MEVQYLYMKYHFLSTVAFNDTVYHIYLIASGDLQNMEH